MTTRPRLVLAAVAAAALLAALGLPRLRADFTPSDLFAKFDDQEAVAAEFRAQFGNTDNVLLLLVQADDVMQPSVLQLAHDRARWLQGQEFAGRVNALTLLQLPREPTIEEDTSVLAGAYLIGAEAARDVGSIVARFRAEPPPRAVAPVVPAPLLALASGEGVVGPAVAGEQVTSEEAAYLDAVVSGSALIEGRLVSADRTLLMIAVSLADGLTRNDQIARVVNAVSTHLDAHPAPDGVRYALGGLPYVRKNVIDNMRADQSVMLPLSLVVCILILFASFRWWPAMVLPTGAVVVSALTLVGGMGWLGEPFNIINNIVPLLIIIIGISNSIHVVNRYGEEIRAGKSVPDAAAASVRAMAVACFLTSFTTAVGFASLVVSQTDVLRRFGVTAAIGVLISYVVSITFLPAALSMMAPPGARTAAAKEGWLEDFVERVTRAVMRYRWPVIALSAVLLAVSAYEAAGVDVDSAVLDQFDEDDEIVQTTRLIEAKLTGVRPLEVYLTSPTPGRFDDPAVLNTVDALAEWALAQEGALSSMSYGTYLREVLALQHGPEARSAPFNERARIERAAALLSESAANPLAAFVDDERTRLRLTIGVADVGAQATIRLADALEARAAELFDPLGGVRVQLTGDAYVGSKGLDVVISDLLSSLGLAVVVIFLFMAVLFRSPRLALLSVPPNVLPLVGTMAFMVWTGVPLNAATAIIFSISIGMAVDGAIHVLARFREESARQPDTEAALVRSARGTGKAIFMTGVSLMLGFGVMFASSFVPVRRFGQLIAITVLGTLIATAVVLPALLRVGDRRAASRADRAQ